MPTFLLVRLYRMLPLLVVLGIIAALVYLFVSWRHTPTHAKHAVIKVFLALNGGLTGFFLVAAVYALLDGNNTFVAEFFLTCALLTAVLLGITYLCRRRFLKKHPNFRWKLTPQSKDEPKSNQP